MSSVKDTNNQYDSIFHVLMAQLNDIVIVLSSQEVIEEISLIAQTYFAWKNDTLLGKTFKSLYSNKNIILPFSLEQYHELINKHAQLEQNIWINNKEVYFSWTALNIKMPHSSRKYIIIGRDISDKKNLIINQRSIHMQLEKIAECVPGNFYWKSTEERYLGCNNTLLKTLGFKSITDIVGKTDKDLWPEQAEILRQNDQKVIASGGPVFLEETVTLPGQGDRFFTVIKMPLVDETGKVIGILGSSLDITELKNTQKALKIAKEAAEAASIAKSEFIANVSHDIRTPLTGIIGMSHILEEEADNQTEKQHAHWVSESGEQLLGLLNGVLDVISSDSANEEDIRHDTFDLYHVIQDVLELERVAVKARQLDMRIHVAGKVPHYVVGDRMKVHRILLNLTGNAIKFTPKGHVSIEVKLISIKKHIAEIQFEVIDTGIGIPEDLLNKVFDRFFKVSPSYKGIYPGNGIGLHIAQKYVTLLGGTMSVKSQVDVGTTFSFVLPMRVGKKSGCKLKKMKAAIHSVVEPSDSVAFPDDHLLSKSETQLVQLGECKNKLMQILLVEDNFLALCVLKNMVEGLPAKVFEAQDTETAFPLVQSQSFDLIITDIGLPGQSGDELTKLIRTWENENNKKPTPIVGLTGHAIGEIAQLCLDAGMNQVYSKPMKLEILKKIIEEFVKSSS